MTLSTAEQKFLDAWRLHGIPESDPVHQYEIEGCKSDANRTYKFDFAWPLVKIVIEVDGHGYGHVTPKGRSNSATKARRALALGWTVIPITTTCMGSKDKLERVCQEVAEIVFSKGVWE